jgi:hypothetical protein
MRYHLRTLLIVVGLAAVLCGYVRWYQDRKLTGREFQYEICYYRSDWEMLLFYPARKTEDWWSGRSTIPLVLSKAERDLWLHEKQNEPAKK